MMLTAAIVVASASVFVGCGDDNFPKGRMGAIGINSLQTTSTSATAYWTIVSDGSCAGYKVTISEGTRDNLGEVVVNQEFDNCKTYHATFSGLQPNRHYVMTTQAIPAEGSGFNEADTYSLDFMTAPIIEGLTYSAVTYSDITLKDKEGNDSIAKIGSFETTWTAIDKANCGGYTVSLQGKNDKAEWANLSATTINDAATATCKFNKLLEPGKDYRVTVCPNPNNACYYDKGETTTGEVLTAPAAN